MKSKNIVFVEPNVAKLIEEDIRTPKEDEILVKIAVSTISSGTERANLIGSKTVAWDLPEAEEAIFPRRLGYSTAGVVEQVGEGVTRFKVGDRVALWWTTHNQYVTISENNACLIDDISFEDAAIFHIATFPLAAIRKCRLEMGESAIVMGMGILGIVALQLLKAAGAAPIIAVDPDPIKREKALKCGADFALNPYDADFARKAKEITNGGAKVGIEVTGIGAGLDGILDCMAHFGRVALLGCTRDSNFNIDYYKKVHGPGITLIGAHTMARPHHESHSGWWTTQDDMLALKKLTLFGRLNLSELIDETHSPEKATEIYTRLATEKTFPLVQFDWRRLK
ncbi:MAG: zinc-binding alcohol dehydrogenase [Clostridia bacterium]|nr:zinc-binding alcohol dehydrogenase [Clostridia bacterium]